MIGPEFLRFYLIYGLAGLALAGVLRLLWARSFDSGDLRWKPGYYPRDEEAYGIALLRGGRKEAARTILARLVAAGLLNVQGSELWRFKDRHEGEADLLPVERRALQSIDSVQPLASTENRVELAVTPELEVMENDLERQGLVLSENQRTGFHAILGVALVAIPGLGLAKLMVALSRGKTNVLFLILMMAVYAAAAFLLLRAPRLTRAGQRYLEWLQESHRGLVRSIQDGRRDNMGDTALVTGIFGLSVLPAMSPLHEQFEARKRDDASSSGSGCGGGDSGGGGDGGGGGCGGGGCGGCGGG
ncbi:MAG TPA: TIGR04222 domain-containing membrane protein [Thermoanaerobaculia bacterium]|nr:TIGR04222 domain-containing membrane protein [Thermoanaerobaculia bacterium]